MSPKKKEKKSSRCIWDGSTSFLLFSGFLSLLQALPDIKLDAPHAVSQLGKFAARLVADDCLPPSVINPDRTSNPDVHDALKVGFFAYSGIVVLIEFSH